VGRSVEGLRLFLWKTPPPTSKDGSHCSTDGERCSLKCRGKKKGFKDSRERQQTNREEGVREKKERNSAEAPSLSIQRTADTLRKRTWLCIPASHHKPETGGGCHSNSTKERDENPHQRAKLRSRKKPRGGLSYRKREGTSGTTLGLRLEN